MSDETTFPPDEHPRRRADDSIRWSAVRTWGGVVFAVAASLAFAGQTYTTLTYRLTAVETKISTLEQEGPKATAALNALSDRILRRLDRLDKATARIDCKLNGPGASCDAAMAAIGTDP
jgi:hypothetical protein